jgi:thioredoxin 1
MVLQGFYNTVEGWSYAPVDSSKKGNYAHQMNSKKLVLCFVYEVIKLSKPVLIDFSATWCGPCRMQKPILEQVEKEFKDQVDFKIIDVDQNRDLARRYGIQAVPTLVIEKDGKVLKRFTGVTSADVLSSELRKAL